MALTFIPIDDALESPDTASDTAATIRGFDCGDDPWSAPLRDYLRNGIALREHRAMVASTYLVYDGNVDLIGYVTLAWSVVNVSADFKRARGLRRIPYPALSVLLISRLAIHRSAQSRGYGRTIIT